MAVPTPDELYDFFTQYIDAKTFNGQHPVFSWDHLNTAAFRHFKSTSNAIGKRMKELAADGRLASVEISYHGYAHLKHEAFRAGSFTLYFAFAPDYHAPERGHITHERPKDHPNPWANGNRDYYTTRLRLDAMTAAFLEAKKQHDEAKRKEAEEEQGSLQGALNALAPDATQLLERLNDVIPGLDKRMRHRSFAEQDRVFLSLDFSDTKDIGAFLDILRRGLPDVPRETKEN
jgi:hypothetical protein